MSDDTLIRTEGHAGRITLNRPRALNALTHEMVRAVDAALAVWAEDDGVALVLVDGAGERGLCAGGDIRALYDAVGTGAVGAGTMDVARDFFRDEYRMNAHIAAFGKPYVAFMDGIVMGGGVGVSAHGSVRVVTERTRLAMPETGIGFLPDVGGTWLLGRAGNAGLHAAMTSDQLGAADAMACGMADVFVTSDRLGALAEGLVACTTREAVSACVDSFASAPPAGKLPDAAWLACYGQETIEAIAACLAARPEAAAQAAAAELARKSPTSLKVTLRALREAPALGSLDAALEREFRLVLHALALPDFREGVRAAVVDKDRNPSWSPARLDQVTEEMVDAFFTAPDHGGLRLQY
jgi:enoyl-CoA hydratase